MDFLGRYYTNQLFSELLVDNIELESPNTILDLGAGGGSLLLAASARWNKAKFIAADIDRNSVKSISKTLPFVKVYHANSLRINIEKNIDLKKSSIDVAVCNPPYLQVKEKKVFSSLLEEANLQSCLKLNKLTSDIVFLAQNLKLLKEGGELGIILPDSILTGQEFRLLRGALLTNHNVKSIIELPDRIFPKTEAKTHILLLGKSDVSKSKIPLLIAGKDGQCYDEIEVKSSALEYRMDFSYHKLKQKQKSFSKKLSDFDVSLLRGNISNVQAKSEGISFIHSTSFKSGDHLKLKNQNNKKYEKFVHAEAGDIVIVRVGRGSVGKVAFITNGRLPVTDCIYVLKANANVTSFICRFLSSVEGANWIKAISHGVCAKVLSRSDIFEMPIPDII